MDLIVHNEVVWVQKLVPSLP